jgi:hypothetical protein
MAVFALNSLLTIRSKRDILDKSFLTGDPCSPPCWHGIIVNESTNEDVYQILPELPFVDPETIREWNRSWHNDDESIEIHYKCMTIGNDSCGGITLSEGLVKRIRFSVGDYATLDAVINRFGSPTFIEYGMWGAEMPGCLIDLEWTDLGISASYLNKKESKLCDGLQEGRGLPSNLSITSIAYFSKEAFPSELGGCCDRIKWPGFENP